MTTEIINNVQTVFKDRFQEKNEITILSPGRINIIGEHIDYNDGYVLPAAIDKQVCMCLKVVEGNVSTIVALDLDDEIEFEVNQKLTPHKKEWVNFFFGVIQVLKEKGYTLPKAFNLSFSSTIPMGAGLSSSAAVECGFATALNTMFEFGITKEEIALIGQKAEQQFVGVNCGIMDQFASVFGKKEHAILLDCNTLAYQYYNIDATKYAFVLFDSRVKHSHLTSGYNDRRNEVESGYKIIADTFPEIKSFRDVTTHHLDAVAEQLNAVQMKRCEFVVEEIARILNAVKAIEANDLLLLGELMTSAHQGLSKKYEVSCDEVDFLVDYALQHKQVIGSRMMGGGFGGCSINLVEKNYIPQLSEEIKKAYLDKFDIEMEVYNVNLSNGTTVL